jgi:hypothetical protein
MCYLDTEDIPLGDSCANEGGLAVTAYYALKSDVLTWPEIDPAPATYSETVDLVGNFVMNVGKTFKMIESDLETSGFVTESAGSPSNLSALSKLTLKQYGLNKALIGFMESHRNAQLVFIFEYADGTKRVLGTKTRPARFESFGDMSGVKIADEKAMTFTAYAPGSVAYFYSGTIPLV